MSHAITACSGAPLIRAYSAAYRSARWEPSDPSTPTTTGAAVTSRWPTVMPVTQLRVTGPGNPRRRRKANVDQFMLAVGIKARPGHRGGVLRFLGMVDQIPY